MNEPRSAMRISDVQLKLQSEVINERVNKQEILGLAGLDGHGQALFLEALAGVRPAPEGLVEVMGAQGQQAIATREQASRAGVSYLPSDRKRNGIFPNLSVLENFYLGNLPRFSHSGWLDKVAARMALDQVRDELSITYATHDMPIGRLSGGNQQKVLLARAMASNPDILLLNEPTRGVDIQTRHVLYDYFRRGVAEQGLTLVVLSTELDEIMELCDRVIVFRDFGISARLDKSEMSMDRLMAAMFGQLEQQAS